MVQESVFSRISKVFLIFLKMLQTIRPRTLSKIETFLESQVR